MQWDPGQYARYADERARPFLDLVARIGAAEPRRVVDVGCGPGNLTALLAQRWPGATIEGIDSSADMIASATAHAGDRVAFRLGDALEWVPDPDVDVVISNATLQWIPTQRELVRRWADALRADGWLAFQLPGNFGSPSHALMRELAASQRWRPALEGVLRHDDVGTAEVYGRLLMDAGLTCDAWETTYLHVLPGDDPVLQWVRGTGLRPVLQTLDSADAAEFEREYAGLLREAYPSTEHGTLFPFRRVFAVGVKR